LLFLYPEATGQVLTATAVMFQYKVMRPGHAKIKVETKKAPRRERLS
jgi:hypothetical protein